MASLIDTFVCVAFLATGEPVAIMDSGIEDLQTNPANQLVRNMHGILPEDKGWEFTDSQFILREERLRIQFEAGANVIEQENYRNSSEETVKAQHEQRRQAIEAIGNARNGNAFKSCSPAVS